MASPIPLLLASFSLVLASLIVTADASVYGAVSFTYDHQKPNIQDPKPKPVEEPKSSTDKPKPVLKKPNVEKAKEEVGNGAHDLDKKPSIQKPKEDKRELYKSIGVQGLVYCKSGSKLLPLLGAVARITCWAKDKNGYESHLFTTLSKKTDKKGYFVATLPISELESKSKVYKCKAFLEKSPLESCKIPTDVNKGLSGALPLPSYHLLADKKMKLYSVGPFVYTSTKPKPKMMGEGY